MRISCPPSVSRCHDGSDTPQRDELIASTHSVAERGGPRNSDRLLRWDPDQGEGVWNATEETELSG